MFERFTSDSRAVVKASRAVARRLRHDWVGTEHLLIALVGGDHLAARVLAAAGVTTERVGDEVARVLGGTRVDDETALRSIGIDLDTVRRQIDEQFGPGAFERAGCRTPSGGVGSPRFSPRAKRAFELSLREAIHLRHRHIGPEHILLGMLREGEGLALAVLVAIGVDLESLRAALLAELRKAS